jgi:hypothetical protein
MSARLGASSTIQAPPPVAFLIRASLCQFHLSMHAS